MGNSGQTSNAIRISALAAVIVIVIAIALAWNGFLRVSQRPAAPTTQELVKLLEKKLSDPDPVVQSYALDALVKTRSSSAYDVVRQKRRDRNFCVRLDCLLSLVALGDKGFLDDMVTQLLKDLHSSDVFLRREALEHLATIGRPAFRKPVAALLRDPDHVTRLVAAGALALLGDSSHADLVKEGLLSEAEHLKMFSLRASPRIDSAAFTPILATAALNDKSLVVRYEAARALRERADAGANEVVRRQLTEGSARREAEKRDGDRLLAEVLADQQDRGTLSALAHDDDPILSVLALLELADTFSR